MIPYDQLPPDGDNHVEPRVIVLSEQQIDAIAKRVESRFYERVGRKVSEKVLWAIGVGAAVLMAWLFATGKAQK